MLDSLLRFLAFAAVVGAMYAFAGKRRVLGGAALTIAMALLLEVEPTSTAALLLVMMATVAGISVALARGLSRR